VTATAASRGIWSRVWDRAGRRMGRAGADGPPPSAGDPADGPSGWQIVWLAGVAMAVSAALVISLVLPAPPALRFALAAAFVMFGPGTAVLMALGSRSFAKPELGLIIAIGMATTVLVAEALIWVGFFYPRPEVAAAATLVLIAVGAGVWHSRKHGHAAGADAAKATGQRDRRADGTSTTASDDAGEG
jgi:hypothetical protein